MPDLPENSDLGDPFDLPTSNLINELSDFTSTGSLNTTIDEFDNDYQLNSETMRLLFVTIAAITVFICLTICISVCVCICLHRRRNSKRPNKKDQQLLPSSSEKVNTTRFSTTISIPKRASANNGTKSSLSTTGVLQCSSTNPVSAKTPVRATYYDNLDDIPFIDESRPTSFIDVTRV